MRWNPIEVWSSPSVYTQHIDAIPRLCSGHGHELNSRKLLCADYYCQCDK